MVVNLKENGKTTKWKVKEFSHGLIIENTLETMLMIRKKAMVFFTGQMVESTRVIGKMENRMVWVFIHQILERQRRADGLKEKEWNGSDFSSQFSIFLSLIINYLNKNSYKV